MRVSMILLTWCVVWAFAGVAEAGLEWSERRVTMDAAPGQKQAEAEFVFRNTGEEPVTITQVWSSCGCTTTALEKRTYEAGEGGRITATFVFGSRVGRHVKTLRITTDEPGGRAVVLRNAHPPV